MVGLVEGAVVGGVDGMVDGAVSISSANPMPFPPTLKPKAPPCQSVAWFASTAPLIVRATIKKAKIFIARIIQCR